MATLPGALREIREAHEDDTALEHEQAEHAHGLLAHWQRIIADGRVTRAEANAMGAALQDHAAGDLASLNNNRRINGMYCDLARRQPPAVVRPRWPDLRANDFRPEAA